MRTILALSLVCTVAAVASANRIRTGQAAFGDWRGDAPGIDRQITFDALPAPFATRSAAEMPSVVVSPAGASPRVPPGFEVSLFGTGLQQPRTLRTAPNGDIFIADGHPVGDYKDFLTGFTASDQAVWSRPAGLTVEHDGSPLVSEDGNGTLWRVAYQPAQ